MNQEIVNAVYGKLDDLRNAFDAFLIKHADAWGEAQAKAVLALLNAGIEIVGEKDRPGDNSSC